MTKRISTYSTLLCMLALLLASCEPRHELYADSDSYTTKQARSSKRGICYNNVYEADIESIQHGISWAYNWGTGGFKGTAATPAAQAGIVSVPMVWNGTVNADGSAGSWATAIRTYKQSHPECEYILAYNEPNLTDQANMVPSEAARRWPALKALAQELNLKIVAPAMNYGTLSGYSDPCKWLDEFFAQPGVSIDDVAALSLHCYMSAPSAVKDYVEKFRKYNKPLWMTEFCSWDGDSDISVEEQRSYMSSIINYFEAEPLIERYSWFKYDGSVTKHPRYGLRPDRQQDGKLSDLGTVYVNMSSLDQNYHYGHNQVIPAEHYCSSNINETLNPSSAVQLKVSSDVTGILEVSDIARSRYVEYKIKPTVKDDYRLIVRYASKGDSKCMISVDGTEMLEIDLPKTGSYTTWNTIETESIPLTKGEHTVRFATSKGMFSMNWWRYKYEE